MILRKTPRVLTEAPNINDMKPLRKRKDRMVVVVEVLQPLVIERRGAYARGGAELVDGGEGGVGPVEGEPEGGVGVGWGVVDVGLVEVDLLDDEDFVQGGYCGGG